MSKSYESIRALDGATIEVHAGEVTALVGQNGAGKSTLMKILAGSEHPDAGVIEIDGKPVTLHDARAAAELGIGIVYQELTVYPDLDVLSNLFLQRESVKWGLVDRRPMERRAQVVLDELGLHVPLDALVSTLTLGQRQTIEIARALLQDSRILILDEPNSALNAEETERLLTIVSELAERGVAVIYISHRLEEVFRIAHRVIVMGDGVVRSERLISETTIKQVVLEMTGKEQGEVTLSPRRPQPDPTRNLEFIDVSVPDELNDVSFTAEPGEIVGLVGLEGSGLMSVYDVVFGLTKPSTGRFRLGGEERAGWHSIGAAVRAGIARVPSDRRKLGAMLSQTIWENVSLISGAVDRAKSTPLMRESLLRRRAAERATAVGVKADSVDTEVHQLSGGNQQKVVLAKWLEGSPHLILLDDPTRGVDIGAKDEIYRLLDQFARQGRIVLFSSSELLEYELVCDRVIVFYKGSIVMELGEGQISEAHLLEAINTGGQKNE
ncbi:sugar ABC transporter ATP-binding protein [Microcella sp.]|uniref:sugar ABC transporter ATP-binding protein n=1 Tax=Microcella sp. TaxID=1913979 RepID=UPI0033151AEB